MQVLRYKGFSARRSCVKYHTTGDTVHSHSLPLTASKKLLWLQMTVERPDLDTTKAHVLDRPVGHEAVGGLQIAVVPAG